MLIDARKFSSGHRLEADICLIGAGAAGITLALELGKGASRVLLLESGGFDFEAKIQSLYEGETRGFKYGNRTLANSRLRYFGGSTNQSGGGCQVLDRIDFEARPWLPGSGWPISYEQLEPFYKRAQNISRIAPDFDPEVWIRGTGYPRIDGDSKQIVTRITQQHPLRFGTAYRKELVDSRSVTVCLYATAMGFETDSSKTRVTELRCGVLEGPRFAVASRVYVLCCGGIENARLLLLAKDDGSLRIDQGETLGNFMEHLVVQNVAEFAPMSPRRGFSNLYSSSGLHGRYFIGTLGLAGDVARAERLQSVTCLIVQKERPPTGRGALDEIWDGLRNGRLPEEPGKVLGRVFEGLDDRIDQTVRRTFDTRSGIFNNLRSFEPGSISAYVEQAPSRESRVTLIDKRDSMGQRQVRLHWKLSRSDKRSLLRTLEILGADLSRLGVARLRITLSQDLDEWPEDMVTHCHHMGTTRMDRDPRGGVVDENCRVHGMENLYVAGSSVYPTVGSAAPTLTIVALAVRLADHLKLRAA